MSQFSEWHDCYGDGWQGLITKESFAHPAKFSKALIERIFDHCLQRGWFKRGDLVGDCFGGIGNGGIIAAYRGLQWVGVELEPRFVDFAKKNFELHAEKWRTLNVPQPKIIQGDSRRFHEVVSCAGIVTSPPFVDSMSDSPSKQILAGSGGRMGESCKGENYGETPGQIGRLKSGNVSAVVTSPPYAHQIHGGNGIDKSKLTGNPAGSNSQSGAGDYGHSPGQIAGLPEGQVDCVVTSPPFSAPNMQPKIGQGHRENCPNPIGQGATAGNIETLQPGNLQAVVTSPPFEDCEAVRDDKFRFNGKPLGATGDHYGQSDGQIGNLKGRKEPALRVVKRLLTLQSTTDGSLQNDPPEDYWRAMQKVYSSCFIAIKPGGVIAVVVKDYVSKGKRVSLCDDTARLLEHCGFQIAERVHAMLTKETRHGDLFNGETVTTKSRKSFFRRLAEKKGSPPIDFEEVIFAIRP